MTVSYLIVFLYSLRAKFNLVQTAGVWSFYITLKPHDEAQGGRAAVGRPTVQESLWTLCTSEEVSKEPLNTPVQTHYYESKGCNQRFSNTCILEPK